MAPVKLIYGSHFSGTEATNEVSQNIEFFLYNHYIFTRGRHNYRQPNFMLSLKYCKAYEFTYDFRFLSNSSHPFDLLLPLCRIVSVNYLNNLSMVLYSDR